LRNSSHYFSGQQTSEEKLPIWSYFGIEAEKAFVKK
jgi:hypothetical protein